MSSAALIGIGAYGLRTSAVAKGRAAARGTPLTVLALADQAPDAAEKSGGDVTHSLRDYVRVALPAGPAGPASLPLAGAEIVPLPRCSC